jgi:sulfate/thiosulfate transport system permease protein
MIFTAMRHKLVVPSVIPGFKLSLSFTLLYLGIIVLIPLSGLFFKTASISFETIWKELTSSRVMHAFALSFETSFVAACINSVFGLVVAWVLARYQFVGKKLVDAIVDLPFAIPTAVAGIALTALYSPQGPIGMLFKPFHIKIAYTPIGIIIALILVGLPFVVRSIQPVLEDLNKDQEEAAACLGASRTQIIFRVIIPYIIPAMLTGFAMAFARALGEYGSVIFIAGNLPNVSEVVPLVIVIKLEQYDYAGASAIATLMLIFSFIILFIINLLQKCSSQRGER